MFRCYSYTIIRERINLCLLKLQFLFLSFRLVLNVICSFLGNSPASEFHIADISELTIGSIFIGRSMKYVSGRIVWGIYTWLGWSGEVAEPIGSGVAVPCG